MKRCENKHGKLSRALGAIAQAIRCVSRDKILYHIVRSRRFGKDSLLGFFGNSLFGIIDLKSNHCILKISIYVWISIF